MARIKRMDQGFRPEVVDARHVIFRGSADEVYSMKYDRGELWCSCPDAITCPDLRCKHQCWLLVRMGGGGMAAVEGKGNELLKAVDAGFAAINNNLISERQKYVASDLKMGEECPVCYEMLEVASDCCRCPACHNHFHRACMRCWLVHSVCCPMCRGTDWGPLRG